MTRKTLCEHCDHFIESKYYGFGFLHISDRNEGWDHEPTPGETRYDWISYRPDLFKFYPDGVGPDSIFHNQRGKLKKSVYVYESIHENETVIKMTIGHSVFMLRTERTISNDPKKTIWWAFDPSIGSFFPVCSMDYIEILNQHFNENL